LFAVFMHGGKPVVYEIPKGSATDPLAACKLLAYADRVPTPYLRLQAVQSCLRIAAAEIRARLSLVAS
jgi:hypothetical protein